MASSRIAHFRLLLVGMVCLLTACGGGSTDEQDTNETDATSALTELEQQTTGDNNRPSALLGVYIAHYLSGNTTVSGAENAVNIQLDIIYGDERTQSETFALLEELGSLLQIDIEDMLNRNPERRIALDAYIDRLTTTYKKNVIRLELLEQQEDEARDIAREKQRIAGQIERSINEALRNQDYGTAGSQQQLLIEANKEEAEAKAKQDEIRGTIRLFEDLIEIAEDRLIAIDQNREILISGLKVVDVPGIDDLNVIKNLNRQERQDATSIFGPTGN